MRNVGATIVNEDGVKGRVAFQALVTISNFLIQIEQMTLLANKLNFIYSLLKNIFY